MSGCELLSGSHCFSNSITFLSFQNLNLGDIGCIRSEVTKSKSMFWLSGNSSFLLKISRYRNPVNGNVESLLTLYSNYKLIQFNSFVWENTSNQRLWAYTYWVVPMVILFCSLHWSIVVIELGFSLHSSPAMTVSCYTHEIHKKKLESHTNTTKFHYQKHST